MQYVCDSVDANVDGNVDDNDDDDAEQYMLVIAFAAAADLSPLLSLTALARSSHIIDDEKSCSSFRIIGLNLLSLIL